MAKTKISEFSANPANNTDIDNINIAEGCAPSGINDAIRELMAQLKDFQVGSAGDSFNGPVGTTTAAAGAFTTLSATGVTTVQAGTSSAPAITTSGDTNTGIFFPAADTIAFTEGGTEAMRINSSGNVGIGTSSPGTKFTVSTGVAGNLAYFTDAINTDFYIKTASSIATIGPNAGSTNLAFQTSGTERARIDSSGNLLVGTTSAIGSGKLSVYYTSASNQGIALNEASGTSGAIAIRFYSASTQVGTITTTTSSTAYNTSSDYRLKNTIAPMTGALAKVALLKPVTYKWNADGSDGEGFIAHELAAVVPGCVTGEKDAVDAEGKPVYQGIDTSFLTATLTAAIQELKVINDALTARVAALETAATSQP